MCIEAYNEFGSTKALNNRIGFNVDSIPPDPFSIIGPNETVGTRYPIITWDISFDAVSYDVMISQAADCSLPVQESNIPEDEGRFFVPSPLANGNYFICINSLDSAGNKTAATNNGMSFSVNSIEEFPYHRMFVTSLDFSISFRVDGSPLPFNHEGLATADWSCTWSAYQAGLIPDWNGSDVIWKALLSTSQVDARDRITIQGGIYNMMGDRLASSAADLWDGFLLAPVRYDEFSNQTPADWRVWTGTSTNGTHVNSNCDDWNNIFNVSGGRVGHAHRTTNSWITASLRECDFDAALYCISPPINN